MTNALSHGCFLTPVGCSDTLERSREMLSWSNKKCQHSDRHKRDQAAETAPSIDKSLGCQPNR